mgnify:CR=1 FL=1
MKNKNNFISSADEGTYSQLNTAPQPVSHNKVTHKAVLVSQKPKLIKLHGVLNARDLGGYETTDGLVIKPFRLIRSAQLTNVTKKDMLTLVNKFHVGIDFDLRTPGEVNQNPDVGIPGVSYVSDSVDTLKSFHFQITPEGNCYHYRNYVTSVQSRKAYHDLFMALLVNSGNQSILWHCASGKDRTGFISAIILYSLGVDYHTILNDYLASNDFLRKRNQKRIKQLKRINASPKEIAHAKVDGGVDGSYLKSALDEIFKDYGSVENYLVKGLNVSIEQQKQIRNMYLQSK